MTSRQRPASPSSTTGGAPLTVLKAHVDEQGQWAFGKEFIAILRERPLPKTEGREGAFFCIYWGQLNADSDGPVEWCRPVPEAEAHALAEHYPELTLRTEPAHREAFVALAAGAGGVPAVHRQLAADSPSRSRRAGRVAVPRTPSPKLAAMKTATASRHLEKWPARG